MNEEIKFKIPQDVEEIKTNTKEEWLNERLKGIGGSEMDDLMGIGDYSCKRKLWYSKTREPDFDESGNFRFSRGKRQEPIARALYSEITGRPVAYGFGTFAKRNSPHSRVNIDGITKRGVDIGVLELKVLGLDSFQRIKKFGLPEGYIAQAQWGAGILGLHFTSYGIFNADSDSLLHFDIEANADIFRSIIDRSSAFWADYIINNNGVGPERVDPESKACQYCSHRKTCCGITKSGINKLAF